MVGFIVKIYVYRPKQNIAVTNAQCIQVKDPIDEKGCSNPILPDFVPKKMDVVKGIIYMRS